MALPFRGRGNWPFPLGIGVCPFLLTVEVVPSLSSWCLTFRLSSGVRVGVLGVGGWLFLLVAVFGPSFLWLGLAFPSPGENWSFHLVVGGSPLLHGVGGWPFWVLGLALTSLLGLERFLRWGCPFPLGLGLGLSILEWGLALLGGCSFSLPEWGGWSCSCLLGLWLLATPRKKREEQFMK